MVENLNYILGLGTLILGAVTLALFFAYILRSKVAVLADVGAPFSRYGLWIGFFLTLGASALTLVYSEVLGVPPCPLCWWQRIFLYPQVILFALALMKRNEGIALQSICLSAFGALFALYHHVLQTAPAGTLPCPADGTVSCAQIFFLEFGFATYPFMALVLFVFLIVVMLFARAPYGTGAILTYKPGPTQ